MKLFTTKRIFARLMFSYLSVTLAILVVVSVVFINLMQRYFFSVEGLQLALRGEKAAALLQEPLLEEDLAALSSLTKTLAFSYDIFLWVTDQNGNVLARAGNNPERLGLQVEQNEIAHVLSGNIIAKQITGPGYNSLFYMAPIYEPGYDPKGGWNRSGIAVSDPSRVIGALAISSSLGPIIGTIAGVTRLGIYAAFGAAALAIIISYTLSRRIASPLEEMNRVALELSRGNYDMRVQYCSADELGRLAETLNFAIDKISSAIEEQSRTVKLQRELISDISHEFRAPLTSLQGFLELMRNGKIRESEYPRYLEIMHRDVLHLSHLLRDLLDLDSLESHRSALQKSRHDPSALLHTSVPHLQLKAMEKGVTLDVQVTPGAPDVDADENRFRQVVVNLVENAIRYSPAGETVTVRAAAHGSGTVFQVIDRGPGIPKDELPFIWNRFYKVDKARTRQDTGSGLGLAIVRRIIELHGGWVSVESAPGQGSTFSFWLRASS
ncbi:MAG: ATP-binding protein [Bacillota bacterium]